MSKKKTNSKFKITVVRKLDLGTFLQKFLKRKEEKEEKKA